VRRSARLEVDNDDLRQDVSQGAERPRTAINDTGLMARAGRSAALEAG
jgi:hypothetical protein